jgi:hypothetical protein
MTAVLQVQVLTALDAKTFAFEVMQGLDGNFQYGIFTYERCEVKLRIIGDKQF